MKSAAEEYFETYKQHSSVLRTWLVAYGIGAPVLVLTNDSVWEVLKMSVKSNSIAICFLAGVAAQVLITMLNKNLMWHSYYGENHTEHQSTTRYKLTKRIRSWFILDQLADLIAIILFGFATFQMFTVLTS